VQKEPGHALLSAKVVKDVLRIEVIQDENARLGQLDREKKSKKATHGYRIGTLLNTGPPHGIGIIYAFYPDKLEADVLCEDGRSLENVGKTDLHNYRKNYPDKGEPKITLSNFAKMWCVCLYHPDAARSSRGHSERHAATTGFFSPTLWVDCCSREHIRGPGRARCVPELLALALSTAAPMRCSYSERPCPSESRSAPPIRVSERPAHPVAVPRGRHTPSTNTRTWLCL
jgi:hypothetical protein